MFNPHSLVNHAGAIITITVHREKSFTYLPLIQMFIYCKGQQEYSEAINSKSSRCVVLKSIGLESLASELQKWVMHAEYHHHSSEKISLFMPGHCGGKAETNLTIQTELFP